jgi:hypothetical protein
MYRVRLSNHDAFISDGKRVGSCGARAPAHTELSVIFKWRAVGRAWIIRAPIMSPPVNCFLLTSILLRHRFEFGNYIPSCTARALHRGIVCSSTAALQNFHWSQGRFELAGIRTRTGSDVCGVAQWQHRCKRHFPSGFDSRRSRSGSGFRRRGPTPLAR